MCPDPWVVLWAEPSCCKDDDWSEGTVPPMGEVLLLHHKIQRVSVCILPESRAKAFLPLAHATMNLLARGHILHARSSFPEHGLLVSSSGSDYRADARAVFSVASAGAKGPLPTISIGG